MGFMKVMVRSIVPACVIAAELGAYGPATRVAFAEAPKGESPAAPKEVTVTGWFKSFADGVLVIEKQKQGLTTMEVTVPIPADAATTRWSHAAKRNVAVDTAEAMRQLRILVTPGRPPADTAESLDWRRAGTGLVIKRSGPKVTIQIGKENPPFVGKFAGYKDDFLAFQVTTRDGRYSKSYGQTLNFRMNEWIAVYESVDGGEYRWVGSPRTALVDLKEGTSVAIYHSYKTELDEFHLVLIGIADKP
jgi:hypothetical protein